jgi:ribosomal protein L11 methyltransferase
MKNFFEVRISISGEGFNTDLCIAQLSALGFDGFMEEEGVVLAYKEKVGQSPKDLEVTLEAEGFFVADINIIEDRNWNAEWESGYQAVLIGDQVLVRAPFHEALEGFVYDIIIEPRMAFGTAHHETTSQVLAIVTEMDVKGKKVLDMGCGTAVIAILALKMGAASVMAIDNDEWAYRNSIDNIALNAAGEIEVLLGDANLLQNREFDIIIANINRNILLQDIPQYAKVLAQQGSLVMSGFYEEDLLLIENKAKASDLVLVKTRVENNWMAAIFISQ